MKKFYIRTTVLYKDNLLYKDKNLEAVHKTNKSETNETCLKIYKSLLLNNGIYVYIT